MSIDIHMLMEFRGVVVRLRFKLLSEWKLLMELRVLGRVVLSESFAS